MAVRVGIDLVSVASVRESIRTHAERYLERVYTDEELRDCQTAEGVAAPERLAARFAAKEAAIKVLRPVGEGVPWRSIGLRRHPSGWPELELSGRARALAAEAGLDELAVSLTHEGEYAAATVVAQLGSAR